MGFRTPEIARCQIALWPHMLDEAVPVDHPVRLIDELLDSEQFAPLFKEWANDYVLVEGKPPYHPKCLAKLYIYGMLNRIRSSRQLEAACYNRVDVMWLMSGQTPDHSTISAFVAKHRKRLKELSRTAVHVGIRAQIVKVNHTCVDSTRIEADAGRSSVKEEETIRKELEAVDQTIAEMESQWQANEKQDATLLGEMSVWIPDGEEDPKKRLANATRKRAQLRKALEVIGRRQEEAGRQKPRAIASVTDPDSRVMPGKGGPSRPNYNAQIVVETGAGMIVAEDVNDHADDCGCLTPMVQQAKENCAPKPDEAGTDSVQQTPENCAPRPSEVSAESVEQTQEDCARKIAEVSADSGYNSGEQLKELEEAGVKTYVPDRMASGKRPTPEQAKALEAAHAGQAVTPEQWAELPKETKKDNNKEKKEVVKAAVFTYDAEKDVYRCPTGQELPYQKTVTEYPRHGTRQVRVYGGCPACATCPMAEQCCKDPSEGRTITRDEYEAYRERTRARMSSPEGRKKYEMRSQTVEPKFGYIKAVLGVRRFLRRGLHRVKAEWTLICTAVNVGILLRNWGRVSKVI